MDVTKVVPKAGFVIAVWMVLALATAAGASAAPSMLSRDTDGDPVLIVYQDVTGNTDGFRVVTGQDGNGVPGWSFELLETGTPFDADNGCSEPNGIFFCLDDTKAEIFVFRLGPLDDVADLGALTGAARRPSDVQGGSGNDVLVGGGLADDFGGGSGDDRLVGLSDGDEFRGQDGVDTLQLSVGGPWTITLNDAPDDGVGDTGTANVAADVEVVIGGPAGDDLTGGARPVSLFGGGGPDILEGGAGADALNGEAGADTILARDRVVDTIACGADGDTVFADWNDTVAADCETVERSARDDDGDGSPSGVDCDDANPTVKPGGGDIPGNGIDEDCAGGDAAVDADGDGAAAAADCDDANPARFPGAAEIPANGIDEDCDGVDGSFPTVAATVSSGWKVFARHTRLTSLKVKDAPAGAKVRVTCKTKRKGCPFKRKSATADTQGKVALTKRFKGARLRPGAVIEVRVSADGAIAKVLRITIRKGKAPRRVTLCLPPGAAKPRACG